MSNATHQNQHVNPHLAYALNLFALAPSYRNAPQQAKPIGKDCYTCGAENITVKNCPVCGTCVTCQI